MPPRGATAAALRSALETNAAVAATLRSAQEMCLSSAIALEREPWPAAEPDQPVPPETPELHLLGALQRTMSEERQLIGLLHRGLADQACALGRRDAEALTDIATAVERYTLTLREALRERIALTRLLAGEWNARGPHWTPSDLLRGAAQRVVALDLSVRAGAGRSLADLQGRQSALAAALEAWEPGAAAVGGEHYLDAVRGQS